MRTHEIPIGKTAYKAKPGLTNVQQHKHKHTHMLLYKEYKEKTNTKQQWNKKMGIKSNMNKHTSQSKYIISCGKQHIKCRFKNQKQWLECNKSIFFPPSIVVCLDIFGWLLLLLLLLLSSHLAQSFVLFLFIHYRRCRYCYCHWLSLFDHFENKYKCHEIAKLSKDFYKYITKLMLTQNKSPISYWRA